VRDLSAGDIAWTDGMLYPLLHRLERLGHVEASWGESPEGRKRKYYEITAAGEAALAEHRRQWAAATRTLGGLWGSSIPAGAW
jgi:DNA-binding PadR family transcriptional regulator